jgi:hypothetical protein
MAEHQLTLTAEERQYLQELLEITLKETQIEEHRTRKPTYRKEVLRREDLTQALLTKLRQLPG